MFALKVLSQTCSASPCERNWSAFDHIHSKKRNRLLQSKLNDLVYIQYNKKLQQRFFERKHNVGSKSYDPIFLREVDENDDWVVPDDEALQDLVNQGDDLTWEQVRAAQQATEARTNTRSQNRRGNVNASQSAYRLLDIDIDDPEVEEEEQVGNLTTEDLFGEDLFGDMEDEDENHDLEPNED
ncbi:unnamed protein product [Cuscuta europaea]|uniref:HAT C-terminal dimerisation domain-containing protein n=1 Tax=Cuscuta europaea TaxID=41803 RepID=A0A9P0ZDU4_CUSEU|nr:unnamed protein product [Cuscuta europaea]